MSDMKILSPRPVTCSHRWYLVGGCPRCVLPHDVAPYLDVGNHRALEPGQTYQCRCGITLAVHQEAR